MIMFHVFPDELLFSAFARYHSYSGNLSSKKTMRDLFGSINICAVPDLPCHLEKLSERIPGKAMNAEYLLQHHTFYPYYEPFINEEKRKAVLHEMIYGSGKSLFMKLGLPASSVKNNNTLQYCDSCIQEDRKNLGTAYWHRSHQLLGVKVCYCHHTWLRESTIAFTQRRNKHEFTSLESYLCNSEYKAKIQMVCNDKKQLYLAKVSKEITDGEISVNNLTDLQEKYFSQLHVMNMVLAKGGASHQRIIPAFIHYWGEELLEQLNCSLSTKQYDSWLHKLLRKQRVDTHPLRHILMHGFLQMDLKRGSIENRSRKSPFGDSPWVCLNKAAEHYGEEVIQTCEVTRDSKSGKPVGTFICSCGFVYSRKGPDVQESDKFKIGRIKEFGHVWQQRLKELNGEPSSLRAMGRKLGVDPMTVKKQMKIFKAPESIVTYKYSQPASKKQRNKKESSITIERSQKLRTNWEERDQRLTEQILLKAEQLITNPRIRISRTELARQIRSLSLIQTKLDKLPITKAILSNLEETKVQFKERILRHKIGL